MSQIAGNYVPIQSQNSFNIFNEIQVSNSNSNFKNLIQYNQKIHSLNTCGEMLVEKYERSLFSVIKSLYFNKSRKAPMHGGNP